MLELFAFDFDIVDIFLVSLTTSICMNNWTFSTCQFYLSKPSDGGPIFYTNGGDATLQSPNFDTQRDTNMTPVSISPMISMEEFQGC